MKEELPTGWKYEQLNKLCLKSNQRDPRSDPDSFFAYIDVSSVSNQSYRITGTKKILGRDAPSRARKCVRKDDVIFATVRPTLKRVALVNREFDDQICSTGFCVLRSNQEHLYPTFLYFHLLTDEVGNRVEALQKGATYPAISDWDLLNQVIILPSLPEQRAIAYVLRTIQQARDARLRELDLEKERKAALMEHLFTHGTRGEPTKQTEIGEMPENWNIKRLDEVCRIRYGLGQPPDLKENGIPMIRATDIKNGRIVSDTIMRVKREAIPERKNPFLNRGDILVVRSGAYTGDLAMYDGRWETAIAGYDLVVSPNTSEIKPEFITYFLLGNNAQSYFRSQRDRSAQPHLNSEQLSNTLIPLPIDIDEQEIISSILQACDAKISTLDNEASLLDELFRAMLEELMIGRLSTTNLIEEEATS